MNIAPAFIIYLTVFRMAIMTAGIISIVLGYRLFCRGISSVVDSGKGTDIHVESGGSRLSLRNAAPGTCFAMFGVLIISVMFATGSPEMTMKTIKDASKPMSDTGKPPKGRMETTELRMRGDEKDTLKAITLKGDFYEQQGEQDKAIAEYQKALAIISTPMNHRAWLYQERGEIDKALPLSRLAVQLSPDDANFLDTLAEILRKTGDYEEASRVMDRAAELNPDNYSKKAKQFRDTIK